MRSMICFDRVAKRYPQGIDALRDISFDVTEGEFAVISGHSGAGKSTVLKLIAGIEQASAGVVLVGGQNVGALNSRALPFLRRNLGLVFQDQKLLFDRSAFDNVMLPLAISGFPRRDAAQRVHAALDKVGLSNRANSLPVALSGGEQQRLAIARAVVNRPNILLVDEPTAHLDADTAADVMRIFREFHRVGVTLLMTTCERDIFPHARRITLDHGRVAG